MRSFLQSSHPIALLAVLTLLGIIAMGLMLGVGLAFLSIFGISSDFLGQLHVMNDPNSVEVWALKGMQIIQAIGLFAVPFVLYRYWLGQHGYTFTVRVNQLLPLGHFALITAASIPMINYLAAWNAGLTLPDGLSSVQEWIVQTEADAESLIRLFLHMDSVSDLVFNLFLIALLPALTEELFFRGTVQPLMLRSTRNVHAAIWLTAFFFSFFHMQFLGFVPRLLLGAVFGYAAHWSGSLALPIVGHLINNGLAVLITYYVGMEAIGVEAETLGANEGEWYMALVSALLLVVGMLGLRRRLHATA
jgi:membrane protease YdiL (CAAX protease family)